MRPNINIPTFIALMLLVWVVLVIGYYFKFKS